MDFAIRNNIYAYNPGACITRFNNPSKSGDVMVNYSGHDMDNDTVEFSKSKVPEDIDTGIDIETDALIETSGIDTETDVLTEKAKTMVKNAYSAEEAGYKIVDECSRLVEKTNKQCKEQDKKLPTVCQIYTIYDENGKTRHKISAKDIENANNAIKMEFGKMRGFCAGRKEDDDLIYKNIEVKTTTTSDITDIVEKSVCKTKDESEYLSYKSRLSCNYDGRPEFYATGYEYNPLNGIQHWDEYLAFDERTGKPKHYYTDMTLTSSYERNYGEHLEYRNGQWEKAS